MFASGQGQTPVLNRMGLDQLKALFDSSMRPGSAKSYDPYALLSAIRAKTEEEKMAQAQRNAAALQQNQSQGLATLAQQVRREADMVRPPVTMARGGIVALTKGGNPGQEAIEQLRKANMVTPDVQAQRDLIAAQIRARELKTVEAARAKLQQLDRAVAQAPEADSRRIFEHERRLTTQALRILESQGPVAALRQGVEALVPSAGATTTQRAAPARAAQQVSTTPVADDQSILGPQGPLLTNQIPAPPGSPASTQPLLPGGLSFRPNTRLPDRMPGESFTDYRDRSIKFQEEALKEERRLKEEREQTERDIELARRGGRPAMSSPFVQPSPQSAPQSTTRFNIVPDERDPLAREAAGSATAGQADADTTATGQSPGGVSSQRTGADVFTEILNQMRDVQTRQSGALENRLSQLRTRQGTPEDILSGQQGIERLVAEQIADEKRMRDERMAQAQDLYQQRQKTLTPDIWRALLGVSTERGKALSSLAENIGKEQDRVRAGKEEARKELTAAQRESDEFGRNILKIRMLEAQRQQAIRQARLDDANKLEDAIFNLQSENEKLKAEGLKSEADIRLRQAQVQKPSELQERINLLLQNPSAFNRLFPSANDKVTAFQVMKEMSQNLVAIMSKGTLLPNEQKAYADRLEALNSMMARLAGLEMTAPQVSRPTTRAEFDALKKGDRYINPSDGKEYIKN